MKCNFVYVPTDDPYCGVLWCTECGVVSGDTYDPDGIPARGAGCESPQVPEGEVEYSLTEWIEKNNKKESENEMRKL